MRALGYGFVVGGVVCLGKAVNGIDSTNNGLMGICGLILGFAILSVS